MSTVEEAPSSALQFAPASPHRTTAPVAPRRGRPPLASREDVLEAIRRLASRGEGLFRIHRQHPDLYARARRMFGSWSRAVTLAGLDYGVAIEAARQRSLRSRSARARGIANRSR